jgi:RNA polymerase-binding transcription factor DksA
MTASFAYSPTRVSGLTDVQLTELQTELLEELRRLTRGSESDGRPRDIRTQSRINLVTEALKRIQAGIYGTCLICRSPIPYARLAVIPETQTCVRCG